MQHHQLVATLKDLGLTENEARVYFAALSLGPATILKIATAAEIKRTTVYSVIQWLQHKGLMTIEVKGFKKLFVAERPEKLETMIEERRERFKKAFPELSALYNLKGGEGFIKYYEGLAGIKSVYEGLIRDVHPHEDYLVITDQKRWLNLDQEYFLDFSRRRAKLPIAIRMLMQDTDVARDFKTKEKNYNSHIKILPKNTTLTTNLVVIPRRVVIHQLTPPILAIVIENKSVVQMHRELFEIIWRSLPE